MYIGGWRPDAIEMEIKYTAESVQLVVIGTCEFDPWVPHSQHETLPSLFP